MDSTDRLTAYFTVEATMVLPIAFCAVYFTICSLFFRYNRCLLEQDVDILLLRGSIEQNQDAPFATKMQEQVISLSKDKYVLWEDDGYHIGLYIDVVSVESDGRLGIRMIGDFFGEVENFACHAKRETRRVNPTLFIRSCNKLREEKNAEN